jgi:TubC N-terminal docking domain
MVVESVRHLGFTLRPVGDTIGVKPAGKLPADLRAELVARKAEILAILAGQACGFFWGHKPTGPCARCGESYRRHIETFTRSEGGK